MWLKAPKIIRGPLRLDSFQHMMFLMSTELLNKHLKDLPKTLIRFLYNNNLLIILVGVFFLSVQGERWCGTDKRRVFQVSLQERWLQTRPDH